MNETSDGWRTHEVAPAYAAFAPDARVSVPVPHGRIEASFANGRPGEVRKIPLSENGKGN